MGETKLLSDADFESAVLSRLPIFDWRSIARAERAARKEVEAALAEARLAPTCIRGEIASLYAEYGAYDRPNLEAVFSAIRKVEQTAATLALSRATEREAG